MSRIVVTPSSVTRRRSSLLASAATMALLAGSASAHADDLWQGFYVGANATYSTSYSKEPTYGKWDGEGWGGGLQAGYNYTSSGILLGAELDAAFENIDGRSDPIFGGKTLNDRLDWSGSARLRAGVLFEDVPFVKSAVVYGTGGFSVANVNVRYVPTVGSPHGGSELRSGWTFGGGVEMGVTSDISVKLEYLHTDYGDKRYDLTAGPYEVDTADNVFRIGLNWHFFE